VFPKVPPEEVGRPLGSLLEEWGGVDLLWDPMGVWGPIWGRYKYIVRGLNGKGDPSDPGDHAP
jgi:hypothetical protein